MFPENSSVFQEKTIMFGKKTLMFFENIKVFFQGECYRADTRVCPESHTYTIEIHPLKPTKKTVQRRVSQVPSRWLRLFPIRFTINILIINIMTSNFGTTGTRAHLYEFPDQDLQSLRYIPSSFSMICISSKRTRYLLSELEGIPCSTAPSFNCV